MTSDLISSLRDRAAAQFPAVRADLERLVRVPSVSNLAFDRQHLGTSAQMVVELLRGVGFTDARVLTARTPDGQEGAPAVVGHLPGPAGAPTVLLYAHHDVQPPGPASDWSSEPFEPTERDGRLYGRGAADDKAGIMAHIGALRALGEDLPVNVTVFIEGEEEIGSPTFTAFLAEHREALSADVIVVADSFNWRVGVPALTTSLRGMVDLDVEVRVLEHAVHSGVYGGPALDAVTVLSRLIATLHDDAGDVAVAGLGSAPAPAVDYAEEDYRADAAVLPGAQLAGTGSITERLWAKPAIAVIGIDAPSMAGASNTLAPSAAARLSVRVAPGQDPVQASAAVRAHLESHAPFGAQVTVVEREIGKPFQAPTDSAAMQAARWAFETAWGTPPVDIGMGGSIPFVADLAETFPEAAILVTGVEDPDSRAHGADESVHLGELEKVVLAEALLLARLGGRA